MRTISIFSSECLGPFIAACGAMWGLGVFSGVSVPATLGMMFGVLLAAAMGTTLMALAVYSDQSGYDEAIFHEEAIFRVEKEPSSV
jgi:hypothetical protein